MARVKKRDLAKRAARHRARAIIDGVKGERVEVVQGRAFVKNAGTLRKALKAARPRINKAMRDAMAKQAKELGEAHSYAGRRGMEKPEAVNHPSHYGGADNAYEAIKVIEAWGLGFSLGNAVKYISRAGKKGNRLEDLQKAAWYLNREIENAKKNGDG